ncbi:hypothetical protein [Mesorhizobium sp. Z1-4]|uniref:hypothetical protein n=1 Tax=Mesorhizobium sp. Z1-4 TaxID=2448478 RepID=UPI000FDAD7D3|nr:hypothetical protein [Mesorhizobium sp. Z1-4]
MVVNDGASTDASEADDVGRLIADIERLRGGLRISVRRTADGLGVHIPPSRKILAVLFLSFWLCGWAVGEYFVLREIIRSGFSGPNFFLIAWIVPWTVGGVTVLWTILWQLFGVERLFFTANALVREWGLLSFRGKRIVEGSDIREVSVVKGASNDLAGIGTIKVTTAGRAMRIGSGLSDYEAELVAKLVRDAAHPATAIVGDGDANGRPA